MGSWKFEVLKTACYVGFPIAIVVMQNLNLTEKFVIQDLIAEVQQKDLRGEKVIREKKKEILLKDKQYWDSLASKA